MVKVQQCPTCGGSSPHASDRCNYCGNYLLHLTIFEQKPGPAQGNPPDEKWLYFRSLKRGYQLMIAAGLLMAGTIYLLIFDRLSEDELVAVSPIWFLLIILGTGGLFTEKAVQLILQKQANDFPSAIGKATQSLSPIVRLAVGIVFLVPFFIFGLTKRFSSPLIITSLMTLVWALVLYLFLFGIFPSL
ncbi:MAG: hypothetical protein SF052_26010 [Bacteroidia bacterium]|nr:hypothetical protein [Bacteroidia bacterium]